MSPPERGSRWPGRRRWRSHREAMRHHRHRPRLGPSDGIHRRPRRQMRRPPQEQPLEPPIVCPDWVFIPFSNVHVARDRAWFKDDYVPYQTRFTNSQGEELEAIGIGTVVLSTRSPVGNERTEITLRNVLHSPDIVSNIVGYPVYEDYYIDPIQVPYSFWRLRNSKGTPVAHFTQEGNKARLGFCKPPPGTESGPNVLPSDKVPAVYWPETERDRFATTQGDSPYGMSDSERAWLKEHWGDEFRFLLNHKLNMYDEGERRQGRKIMMTDMADESRGRDSQSTLRNVPEALRDRYNTLLAVLNFSDTEVEWIEVRYGDLKTFLDWFRFKLYEPDELKGAKQHLRWLMEKEAVLRKLAKDHRMI